MLKPTSSLAPVSFLRPATSPGIWRLAASGLAAVLIGIGLSRFAYAPLLPALIRSGWFAPAAAAWLGAAISAAISLVPSLRSRFLAASTPRPCCAR